MSTVTSSGTANGVGASIRRVVRGVSVTVPAGPRARAAAREEALRIYGFDLSDEERAEKIRARRGR